MTVPTNKLQERLRKLTQRAKRPNLSTRNEAEVEIIQVYDTDYLRTELGGEVPSELAPKFDLEPGTLWAKVRLVRSGKEIIVGFRESEASVLSLYGNSVLMAGLRGTISYSGLRPDNGRLSLTGSPQRGLRSLGDETQVYDIGAII